MKRTVTGERKKKKTTLIIGESRERERDTACIGRNHSDRDVNAVRWASHRKVRYVKLHKHRHVKQKEALCIMALRIALICAWIRYGLSVCVNDDEGHCAGRLSVQGLLDEGAVPAHHHCEIT
jgi:hypothetical protein